MSMNMFDMLNLATGSQDATGISKAIDKVKAEMGKEVNNSYVQCIGKYLLEQLSIKPELAEKILSKDKTIVKSLDAMRAVALKKKTGNFALLTGQEGFDIVIKYFSKELDSNTNKPGKEDNKIPEPECTSEADSEIETDDEE